MELTGKGRIGDDPKSMRIRITAVIAVFVLLMGLLFLGILVKIITSPPSPEIGMITVDINGREANVTVELLMDGDIDIEDSSLSLQFNEREIPLDIDGHVLLGKISKVEFERLMELRSANITGDLVAKSSLPFDIRDDIREEIDLSFLADIGEDIEISGINTTIHSLAYTRAEIEFTVEMEKDVHLKGEDTEAKLYASINTYDCDIEEVEIKPDGSGSGSILVPFSAIIFLSLSTQNITLEFWGISFTFPFSISG
ncbi:MAG: hypothetical protein ACMUIG_07760 [Thermoplasmatota archaeon]